MAIERWTGVVGLEQQYRVSTHGRVFSVSDDDFLPVRRGSVRLKVGGRRVSRQVAHLVLESFDRPPLPGQRVVWRDGNVDNVGLENLFFGSQSEHARRRPTCPSC